MRARTAFAGMLLVGFGFGAGCGSDELNGSSKERCGNDRCRDDETPASCPEDCTDGGTGTGGAGGASTGGRGGSGARGGSEPSGGTTSSGGTTGGTSDSGGSSLGGSSGRGGTGGTSGEAGEASGGTSTAGTSMGGSAGSPSSPGSLGASCREDDECDSGLFCLTSGALADGSGPPNGLCTLACEQDSECLEVLGGSYCAPFTETEAYCVEPCTTGSAGEPKCHERADFACSLLGVINTTATCDTIEDCDALQLCNSGRCADIVPACLPVCGGDFDCASGQYCDFGTGFCVDDRPTGLPIGSLCTPPGVGDPEPCNGFCVPTNEAETEGECQAFCSFAPSFVGCGWEGEGEEANAGCLYATILSPPGDIGAGDLGLCAGLCDCNDQCEVPGYVCIDESGGYIEEIWGRQGYCRALGTRESIDDTFQTCPGAGGSGGSSGTGGAGGEGGG